MTAVHRKRAGSFILLTVALSWGLIVAVPGNLPTKAAINVFIPMLSAILLQRFMVRRPLRELGLSVKPNRWFLAAWLLPAVLAFAVLGAGLLLPGVEWSWDLEPMFQRLAPTLTQDQLVGLRSQTAALPVHLFWVSLLQGLFAGITINAVAGFGEELGWRGFLQQELEGLGFWRMSLVIGLVWSLWHTPLMFQGRHLPLRPGEGAFLLNYAAVVLYAPFLSYIRMKSGSVIAAAIGHGTLNGMATLTWMTLKGGSEWTVGMSGLAGLGVLLAANVGLFAYDRWFGHGPRNAGHGAWPLAPERNAAGIGT